MTGIRVATRQRSRLGSSWRQQFSGVMQRVRGYSCCNLGGSLRKGRGMPVVMLKQGPLNGIVVTIADGERTYRTRSAGLDAVYEDTQAIDPATRRQIFAYRPLTWRKVKPDGR